MTYYFCIKGTHKDITIASRQLKNVAYWHTSCVLPLGQSPERTRASGQGSRGLGQSDLKITGLAGIQGRRVRKDHVKTGEREAYVQVHWRPVGAPESIREKGENRKQTQEEKTKVLNVLLFFAFSVLPSCVARELTMNL